MKEYNQTILKRDAQKEVIQESYFADMAFRATYDGDSNIIYKAYARPGSSESAPVWQISLQASDVNGNITSITWPQNEFGAASSEFIFSWADRASYTYS